MTTLDTEAGTPVQTQKTVASRPAVERKVDTAALITEQQVLLGSAAALAPAPARHRGFAHDFVSSVRAVFARPEKSHTRKHYPQRFNYLENSAMSREMDRL